MTTDAAVQLAVVYFAATVLLSCPAESARSEETVVVFIAAGTTNAHDEIKTEIQKDTGVTIETS